jgi:PAS domain S-box-containing protein
VSLFVFIQVEDIIMSDKITHEEAAFPVQSPGHTAFKIAFIYASISVLWILFSDQLLSIFVKDIEIITRMQMVKGWFFVLTTSYIIFFLLQKDIKKYIQVEETLRHIREQLLSLMDAMPMALSWADDQGNIQYSNNKFRELFGYTLEDIPTVEKWFQLAFPDQEYRQTVVSNWQIAVENALDSGPEIVPIEVTITCKDGSTRYVAVFGTLLHDRILAVFNDLSDSKRVEREKAELQFQLLQAHKMESIGNLAGGIAHDFNNILSSILGYTELALDDVEKGTMLESNLEEVYTAGKRARDLVKQILAFARQTDEELKPIRVDKIAMEVLKLIRSTIPVTIEIRHKIESDSLIMGSPTQVHQIFVNLCTNAAQAMDDTGGVLEVGLMDVKLDATFPLIQSGLKPGNYLKATISDTGPGISPDIIDSIFEPYFTTKGVGEGTGMGLAMVHGIVEGYGGKVTVETELDKGTVFSIYLPITQKRDVYRSHEVEDLPHGNEHILLVDDELPIAKMSSQILERLGYRVVIRTSSIAALELFRSRPSEFDLIITDMTMPNMTGDVLAMQLIALRSDIPVILCTGYSKKISDEKASQIGIKAFAYKPMVKADLAKTVRKVLDEAKS